MRVMYGHFDIENLETQLITDAAAVGMQQTKPNTDDYHQSQMASRGAGHITQTSIEQQWESQLINDAEFMANTQLPSVTFDINNSDISQQLGQRVGEVSRFQHVDPPRNANGFWQRIEQRYKNNFERQALIAEGRAAANSEVMSESLGHAAVNQQNYLDIGYSESVVQTRAAEWATVTELPWIIPETGVLTRIGKGIMQASSLMNRWGIFGRAEKQLNLLGNEASNHINALRLQHSLTINQAKSIFTETGKLTLEAIENSTLIAHGNRLGNKQLRDALSSKDDINNWAKYSTKSIQSPSGSFQIHFYKNSITNEIYYDMDYKAVFDHQGLWNFEPRSSFDYEPPRFNL